MISSLGSVDNADGTKVNEVQSQQLERQMSDTAKQKDGPSNSLQLESSSIGLSLSNDMSENNFSNINSNEPILTTERNASLSSRRIKYKSSNSQNDSFHDIRKIEATSITPTTPSPPIFTPPPITITCDTTSDLQPLSISALNAGKQVPQNQNKENNKVIVITNNKSNNNSSPQRSCFSKKTTFNFGQFGSTDSSHNSHASNNNTSATITKKQNTCPTRNQQRYPLEKSQSVASGRRVFNFVWLISCPFKQVPYYNSFKIIVFIGSNGKF